MDGPFEVRLRAFDETYAAAEFVCHTSTRMTVEKSITVRHDDFAERVAVFRLLGGGWCSTTQRVTGKHSRCCTARLRSQSHEVQ